MSKFRFLFCLTLSFVMSGSLSAADSYYWAMADNQLPEGKSFKILVLGKRVTNEKLQVISDTQLYASGEEGIAEYTYEFHFKTKKMIAIPTSGKERGAGTFSCDGGLKDHKRCDYQYNMQGKNPYRATGNDQAGLPGILYREESQIVAEEGKAPVVFRADYVEVSEAFYKDLRKKLLSK